MDNSNFQRRRFIKSSAFGLIGITSLGTAPASDFLQRSNHKVNVDSYFYRYPGIDDGMVSGIVGASHGNFDKVKELIGLRPELAGACWDWGFGDFETALGAASHVGRRDIAEFLMANGARPDIFTFTMMGMLKSVQEITETIPGIQTHGGPHGITLLQHAKNRLEDKNIAASDSTNVKKVIAFLESLGNADSKPKNLDVTEDEKKKYLGEYRFGIGENEIFVVDQHRLGFLQVGRKGSSPRKMNKTDDNIFSPAGAPSVKLIFKVVDGKAVAFSVHEPQPVVTATRI